MKWLVIFLSVIAAYNLPFYFSGELSQPMLLEAGIKSGVVIAFCANSMKDFRQLRIDWTLKLIMLMELGLIFYSFLIIADWDTQYLRLDQVIGSISQVVFWIEIMVLMAGGTYAAISTYLHNRDIYNRAKNSAKGA